MGKGIFELKTQWYSIIIIYYFNNDLSWFRYCQIEFSILRIQIEKTLAEKC